VFQKNSAHLVVLRDLDDARAAVEEALTQASEEEAPGLRRALAIIDSTAPNTDLPLRWASRAIDAAGVDPSTHEVHAVRAVRKALPGLGLADAARLVRRVRERRQEA
jgi:hypothetical protein